ncbi:hypothetical protein J7L67_06590 [bacterium]|nr:hypothetical protein [bacterium]
MEFGISYFDSRLIDHFLWDLQKIKEAGCTYIVHTFSEADMNFNFENVAQIVKATKEAGLKAHIDPWGVAGIFGGETYSLFIARNLDVRQITSDGSNVAHACLNNPKLIEFMKKWVDAVYEVGADTIFWDEPHFYVPGWFGIPEPADTWGCRCEVCKKLFFDEVGEKMPEQETGAVLEFKRKSLINFLTQMCAYVSKKGIENTVCMLPNIQIRESGLWEKIASIKYLSGFGTDPYWINRKKNDPDFNLDNYMRPFCAKVKSAADTYSLRGHIWIQNFSIPEGWENDIKEAVKIASEEGIEDIAAWCYLGAKGMSSLKSDNPELVWKTLKQSYDFLR